MGMVRRYLHVIPDVTHPNISSLPRCTPDKRLCITMSDLSENRISVIFAHDKKAPVTTNLRVFPPISALHQGPGTVLAPTRSGDIPLSAAPEGTPCVILCRRLPVVAVAEPASSVKYPGSVFQNQNSAVPFHRTDEKE